MKPYIVQLYQYVFGNRANLEDKVQLAANSNLSNEIIAKKINRKLTEIAAFFSELNIDDMRPFLRSIKNTHLETILFKNATDPISLDYIISDEKTLNSELDQCNDRYNLIKDEKGNISEKNRLLFRDYFLMAKLICEKIEKIKPSANNTPVMLAYKILVLFGNNSINPFETLEKYLIKFNYYNTSSTPLYKVLSQCELRNNTIPINLKEWRTLIQANNKVIKFFSIAPQIENKLAGNTPKNFKEVQEIAKNIIYKRAKEYPILADLFLEYEIDEKTFDRALEVDKRRKKKDNLPDISIHGIDIDPNLAGYHLRKLPIDDPRAYVLGEFTNCCQSMGGNAEKCVIDGITRENNGFYVLEKKFANANHIVGQGYAWISKKGTLVFDSWENLTPSRDDEIISKMLINFSKVICDQKDSSISRVTIGYGGKTP